LRDEQQVISHHLLDSLAVLPQLGNAKRLADIGSGGGLPGIPLAIARPDLQVALVESNQKKSAFQQQAKIELGLANVSVHCDARRGLAAGREMRRGDLARLLRPGRVRQGCPAICSPKAARCWP
jgi:16S rRNA (guanine(527)-N(7))-methyltransferase RsmG